MPGDGFDDGGGGEEQLWAYRCKLYIFRHKSNNYVDIGTGKGSLRKSHPSSGVEFVFEDEKMKLPVARHLLDHSTPLKSNAGTDKGWSWKAKDQIQAAEERSEDQWFTIKFPTVDSANKFKSVWDMFKPQEENEGADDLTHADALQMPMLSAALPVSPTFGVPPEADALESPETSCPASPEVATRTLRSQVAREPREAFLLYFEKGSYQRGAAVRQASTIYIGAYDTKVQALANAIRAMDHNCDPTRPWRERGYWSNVEDNRMNIGDKGVVILVQADDGAYYQTKLRKMPLNMDLPHMGGNDTQLWC